MGERGSAVRPSPRRVGRGRGWGWTRTMQVDDEFVGPLTRETIDRVLEGLH